LYKYNDSMITKEEIEEKSSEEKVVKKNELKKK
jgi:hypothetical protein